MEFLVKKKKSFEIILIGCFHLDQLLIELKKYFKKTHTHSERECVTLTFFYDKFEIMNLKLT